MSMSEIATSTLAARKFHEVAGGKDPYLTPLKLLKLVYIAHGWHLALHNDVLVDENVLAWPYGPVFRDLYRATRKYNRRLVAEVPMSDREYVLTRKGKSGIGDKGIDIIKAVSERYIGNSGWDLTLMTHKTGTPWHKTYKKHDGISDGPVIENYLIQEYYTHLLNN